GAAAARGGATAFRPVARPDVARGVVPTRRGRACFVGHGASHRRGRLVVWDFLPRTGGVLRGVQRRSRARAAGVADSIRGLRRVAARADAGRRARKATGVLERATRERPGPARTADRPAASGGAIVSRRVRDAGVAARIE